VVAIHKKKGVFIYDFIFIVFTGLTGAHLRQQTNLIRNPVQCKWRCKCPEGSVLTISAVNLVIVAVVNLEVAPSWYSRLSGFDAWCGDWQ